MVGIFLALLELIRDKLVWAEQAENSPQIYVRSLTDEPAEQAVRKAIMAVGEEEEEPATQAESSHMPPIPIVELPAKGGTQTDEVTIDEEAERENALADDDQQAYHEQTLGE